MKKKSLFFGTLCFLIFLFPFVLFLSGETGAATKYSQNISKEEEEVYLRLTSLSNSIAVLDEFSEEELIDVREQYKKLFSGLPQSRTLLVLKNQFSQGALHISDTYLEKKISEIEDTVIPISEWDVLTDKEKRSLEKKRESLQTSSRKAIKTLQEKLRKLPRVSAVINLTPKSGHVPLPTVFDGIDSYDPANITIPSANYNWSFFDHDGTEKNLGTGPNKSFTFETPGKYVLRLEVSSASQKNILPGIATKSIQVEPPKLTANFTVSGEEVGSVVKIPLQDAKKGVRFSPRNTIIPEGASITEYLWNFNGEKRSTHTEPLTISKVFSKKGEYKISLNVYSNMGKRSEKIVRVMVQSSVAVIDIEPEEPMVHDTVIFDGQRSSLDGSNVSRYTWKIFDLEDNLIREIIDQPQFSYSFDEVGTYMVHLEIGNEVLSSKQIEVRSNPPVARFTVTKESSHLAKITFDASQSYDPEGKQLVYHWDFDGDGRFDVRDMKTSIIRHEYTEKGTYFPRLSVSDVYGQSESISQEVHIPSLFFIDILSESFVSQKGKEIIFRVDTNEGEIFYWDFGDGNTISSRERRMRHSFEEEGNYFVTMKATNASNESISVTKEVSVGDGISPIPVLSMLKNDAPLHLQKDLCGTGKHGVDVYRHELLQFSAEGSMTAQGSKNNLEYQWNFGGEKKSGISVVKNFPQLSNNGGCLPVTLTVTDVPSGQSKDSQKIYIFVKNTLPEISEFIAAPTQVPCITPCTVKVSLSGVNDRDGVIQEYWWWAMAEGGSKKVDPHVSRKSESEITLPPNGLEGKESTYILYAELVDNDGGRVRSTDILSSNPSVRVKNGKNPFYSVDFFSEKTVIPVGEKIFFTAKLQSASGVVLPDKAFSWDFNGDGIFGDTSGGPSVAYSFSEPGEYIVSLQVQYQGHSERKSRTIYITEQEILPVAAFSIDIRGLSASFDANSSKWNQADPQNSISYFWDFDILYDSDGDGIIDNDVDATEEVVTHVFPKKGDFSVQLTIKNAAGETDVLVQEFSLGNHQEVLSQNDIIKKSMRLLSDVPMTTLEVVARMPDSLEKSSVEIIAFGFNADGSLLEGDAVFTITNDLGTFSQDTVSFEEGYASTFFFPKEEHHETFSVEVSVETHFGKIAETISF
jgi:PKD repeat protein